MEEIEMVSVSFAEGKSGAFVRGGRAIFADHKKLREYGDCRVIDMGIFMSNVGEEETEEGYIVPVLEPVLQIVLCDQNEDIHIEEVSLSKGDYRVRFCAGYADYVVGEVEEDADEDGEYGDEDPLPDGEDV